MGLSALIRGSETAMASVIGQFGSLSSARFKSGCGSVRPNKTRSPSREDNEVNWLNIPSLFRCCRDRKAKEKSLTARTRVLARNAAAAIADSGAHLKYQELNE